MKVNELTPADGAWPLGFLLVFRSPAAACLSFWLKRRARHRPAREYAFNMSMALEEVAREAIDLPRHQRLALARLLIELDDPGSDADVEAAWEAEIQARLRAVKEGRVKGLPYEEVLARVDKRLGS
jgi:putative addiction module component (TIGR02574 family)